VVSRLAVIAPRLARAHAAVLAEERDRDFRLRIARRDVLRLERLVEHRELQYLRSVAPGRTRRGSYLDRRQTKLADARAALERARQRLNHLKKETNR
jgi:septal ring factor EnvC (AmiA/AmiB activator)